MAKSHATLFPKKIIPLYLEDLKFLITIFLIITFLILCIVSNVLEQQIEHNFQQRIANVKHDNPFRSVKINLIKNQHREDLDALKALKKREKIKKEKTY